jgi:outer membrane protein OmpA-like peptidoglycan-associated protein
LWLVEGIHRSFRLSSFTKRHVLKTTISNNKEPIMRFRNWLLTGTSITLLALAPVTVAHAQDANNADLKAAYQAFAADQSDANKQKLTEACIAAGFQSLDDCIAALSGATPVQSEAAPPPSSEAAPPPPPPPPPSEEPAPAPSSEAAPAPAPSSEEAAPAPAPAPSSEEAAPAPAPSSEEAAPAPAPAPSSEEAAPAPVPSSEAAPTPAPAPAPSSEEAAPAPKPAPAPSSEQAAPSSEAPAPAPSTEQAPANNALADLQAAVNLYNEGVAQLDAGDAGGQAKIDQANATIQQICANAGFTDVDACLAQFGLALNPLPPKPGASSAASEQPPAASSEPAPAASSEAPPPPPASSEAPISELPNASEAVTPSAVEVLPPDVAPSEAAPILDSAKDESKAPPDQGKPKPPPPPAEPAAPPPKDDKAAQEDIKPLTPEQQSALTDKGKEIDVQAITIAPPPQAGPEPIKVIQPPPPPKTDNGAPPPPQNSGVIFQIGVNIVINNPTQERDRLYDPRRDKIYYEDIGRGRTRETITRADGTKIVTVRDRYGDILQRSKILRNGKEILLSTYDPNDNDLNNWRDPGDDLPPLQLNIPASQYILDADSADEADVTSFLEQPPVEKVRRIYTIDEVKRSARLRDSVRRLEIGGLTFDTGKATISRNQVGALSKVADAMQKLLDRDPGEVFLIEGHTDAVGSDVANLVLSDNRAATVARILTDFYDIPPENLVTQGYGERFLKVKTDAAEPLNRRVTIKRITPLISVASN